MQRSVLKRWWQASVSSAKPGRFEEFAAGDARTVGHVHWPNWFLAQDFRRNRRVQRGWPPAAALLPRLAASLWHNVRLGVQAMFNTWVLTLPSCALMLFGWYDGWNNSFNKGYEQFSVGPATSWFGIMLFAAAMLYVPMAQARQAITGEWRALYQLRLGSRPVRRGCACRCRTRARRSLASGGHFTNGDWCGDWCDCAGCPRSASRRCMRW